MEEECIETDRRVQRPAAERQPQERGWMRRIPGSGAVRRG